MFSTDLLRKGQKIVYYFNKIRNSILKFPTMFREGARGSRSGPHRDEQALGWPSLPGLCQRFALHCYILTNSYIYYHYRMNSLEVQPEGFAKGSHALQDIAKMSTWYQQILLRADSLSGLSKGLDSSLDWDRLGWPWMGWAWFGWTGWARL